MDNHNNYFNKILFSYLLNIKKSYKGINDGF